MTDMHYDDPQFELVDGPSHAFDLIDLTNVAPVNLDETDEPPTGEPIHKDGDHSDEDIDVEVLREN